mgnify:CR=1 FL=1
MSTELPPSLTAAMPLLDRLHLAVWFFDMHRQHIVWANRQALQLWDAADLASLQERNFSIRSEALRTRLAVYQAACADWPRATVSAAFYTLPPAVAPQTRSAVTPLSGGINTVNVWQGRSCLNCHTQVHGSNNPSAGSPAPSKLFR